ncbi:hypothetical protein Hsc_4504 [Herbaspirillum seropedicae]|nr:hypothetical protein Hsc_4504 [Herbaspirillum seropedicae]
MPLSRSPAATRRTGGEQSFCLAQSMHDGKSGRWHCKRHEEISNVPEAKNIDVLPGNPDRRRALLPHGLTRSGAAIFSLPDGAQPCMQGMIRLPRKILGD